MNGTTPGRARVAACVAAGAITLGGSLSASAQTSSIWRTNADYSLTTRYASTTRYALADFVSGDGSGITFALGACDANHGDYYDSVTVGAAGTADAGKLVVTANSKGHVHAAGEHTTCSVTAEQAEQSEDQTFELSIPSPRAPSPMDDLVVQGTSFTTVTVRVGSGSHPFVRLGIRRGASGYTYYLVRNVGPTTDLTFTGLTPATTYDIEAARMNRQGFHLWGGRDDAAAGVLAPATTPAATWRNRLRGGGVGKATSPVSATTTPLPVVALRLSPTSISENGGVATVTAMLDKASDSATTITVSATPVTPAVAGDVVLSTNRTLTIAAGDITSTGEVTVTGVDNAVEAADKRVTVSGGATNSTGVTGPADVPLTILDDDTSPPNTPPTVSAACDPCTVPPGGEVRLTATAEDPDGDTLRYRWTAGEGSFRGANDRATSRWTAPDETGRVTIRVRVSDGRGGSASDSVDIDVREPNTPPTVSAACDPCTVPPGGEVRLTATAEDPDGDPLTYAWSAGNGSFPGATAGATARWTAPAETGRVTIRVQVSDGRGGSASDSVDVEVHELWNTPPTVSAACDPCTVPPGGEVRLTATAEDPDGDPLTYAWSAGQGSFPGATDGATARWTAPAETGRVTIQVHVSDERGGSASADVDIEVTNQPPVFEESIYFFELQENLDGRRNPVELGRVTAEDPDGDELTYEMASGDRERFEIGARDGVVRYIGPGEDFESEPNRYELRARAGDAHGGEARARVIVTVIDVNEPPQARDDEATTGEDQAVTVDVLANDTDPDGDGLRVESVATASYGETAVTAGGVLYTPFADYHGTDSFTYVASDGAGGTATAAVQVTVLPMNDAPLAVGAIPDQFLDEGGPEATVDLTPFFDDVDGDALTFHALSSDTDVATVMVAGAVLTLAPVVYGSASVTVTAQDPGGLTATQTFAVGVSDWPVRVVLWNTLAAMARSHLASARMTLSRRVAGAGEGSRLTVLGRSVPLGRSEARAALERMLAGWASSAGEHGGRTGNPGLGTTGGGFGAPGIGTVVRGGMWPGTAGGMTGLGGLGGFGTAADPLRGSEFLLAWRGDEEPGETRPGRRWRLWGQGDVQTFGGAPSARSAYDGDLRTGYLGVDTRLTERSMAGLAVSRSHGGGGWRVGSARGSLSTTLTAAYPYLQWSDGASSVWAMAGGGRGAAENVRAATGLVGTSGLNLRLGLVEVRQGLEPMGGVRLGVRADAAWAQLATETGSETIDAQAAAVNQVRVGAEVSRPLRLDSGLSLSPFGEAHVRRDGGAGQTGAGVEFLGGVRAAGGRVRVDAQGRLLALHSAAGYRERGAAVTLSVGDGNQEGLSLSVSPRWGDAAAGGGALWQEQVYRRYRPEAAGDEWALDVRGEYGTRLDSGWRLTWFGSLNQSRYGRGILVGGRVDVGIGTAGATLP